MSLLHRVTLCLGLLLPMAAAAQPAPDSAQVLQDQLQSWLAGLLGPGLAASAPALRVTAEADHYRIAVPIAGAEGQPEITAAVRPLDAGHWAVDAIRFPATTKFTAHLPEPPTGPNADPKAAPVLSPTDFTLRIGAQDAHGLIDPSLTSRSTLDVDVHDIDVTGDGPRQHQQQHIDEERVHTSLAPGNAGLDLDQEGTITGWRTATRIQDQPAVAFGIDRMHGTSRIEGLDRDHAAALLAAITSLIATLPPAGAATHDAAPLSEPARAALRTLITSLRGVVTTIRGEETIDGLHVAVAGKGETTIRNIRLGMDGAAPDGVLHGGIDIALDGLAVKDMPPEAAALVPSHVELRPTLAGVPVNELTKLALEATDDGVDRAQLTADAMALLDHGGVTVGLDAISLALGPAELHGAGHVLLTGPSDYHAEARLASTGLDELMQQANGNPHLQQAVPVLAMLRGLGRPEGKELVWAIVADNTGMTVNGVPIGGGGGGGGDKPHHPGTAGPQRPANRP